MTCATGAGRRVYLSIGQAIHLWLQVVDYTANSPRQHEASYEKDGQHHVRQRRRRPYYFT